MGLVVSDVVKEFCGVLWSCFVKKFKFWNFVNIIDFNLMMWNFFK